MPIKDTLKHGRKPQSCRIPASQQALVPISPTQVSQCYVTGEGNVPLFWQRTPNPAICLDGTEQSA